MFSGVKERLLGLLVASRDEPGVLYRVTEVIYKHRANIEYIAGGARKDDVAELQLEVSGTTDENQLVKDIEALEGITKVNLVPTFQRIYGKRVIVIGGGAASRSTPSLSSARSSWQTPFARSRACIARASSCSRAH